VRRPRRADPGEQPPLATLTPTVLLDAGVALASPAVVAVAVTGKVAVTTIRPVVTVVLRPPLVPRTWQPGVAVDRLAGQGRARRLAVTRRLSTTLDRVVPAAADVLLRRVDLEAVVRRVDLAGVAQDVVVSMDLPEVIRESTAAVSSESVRLVRMRGIAGDAAVGRLADRLRRRPRPVGVAGASPPPDPAAS
jgi:hypothetical protein